MQPEIVAIQRELKALRREVRRQRRRSWLIPLVALLALVPLAVVAATPFNDLVPGSVHNGNIDAIYNAGVTTGCVPNQQYCPTDLVTRQEMASFLARVGGLGSNPPVANAAKVNGFYANDLVRANVGGRGPVLSLNGAYQSVAAVSLVLPGPGLIYVTGATYLLYSPNYYSAVVAVRLIDATSGATSLPLYQDTGVSSGTVDVSSVSPTMVFLATSGGTRTFALQAGVFSGAGSPGAVDTTISALYVPFGPGGLQGADLPDPSDTGTPPPPR